LALCELAFFVGMVTGSMGVGRMKFNKPGKGFIFGAAIVGVTVLLMAFSRVFAVFLFWNLCAGLAVPLIDIPVKVWVQTTVPDAFMGRVNSVMTMIQVGVMPIGVCLGGLLVAQAGISLAFLVMGGGMALAALAGLLDREFRLLEMPLVPAKSVV
jgi:hypothetical protein